MSSGAGTDEHKAELDKIAQEKFGKSFDECDPHERIQVGGTMGGHARGGHSADPEHAPPPPEVKFGEDMPAPGESESAEQK